MTQEDSKKIPVAIDQELSDLIPAFLDNRHKDLSRIRQALDLKNFSTLRQIGHSMKGSGGGYGFEKLSQLGQALEQAALDSNGRAAAQAADDLDNYLTRLEVVYVPDPEDNQG